MKKIILVLTLAIIITGCKKDEEVEFWDILNCYMIVNNTNDIVNLKMNYPKLTYKDLQPKDTFKFIIEWTQRQPGIVYDDPYNAADTCILTIKGKEFSYNKQDTTKGNPLFFNNYKVEKITDLYFNLTFEIDELNYKDK